MLKKLDHPIVWGTLFGCFLAPFGFAASGACERVPYAGSVNAVLQHGNEFERHWVHSAPGVKPFALLLILVGAAAVALFFWQLHLTRQCMRDLERATNAARKAANEKTAALAQLTDYHLEPELFI